MCSRLLQRFSQSVIAGTLDFALTCWGGRPQVWETNRLNKLVRKASSVAGLKLASLKAVVERRVRDKICGMWECPFKVHLCDIVL